MILGIGVDLCDTRRIEKTIMRFETQFIERIFTEEEIAKAIRRMSRVETYAKIFAAKEACAKALGTGFRQGVTWLDINMTEEQALSKPSLRLSGGALKRLHTITPAGMKAQIDVSITEEEPFTQAFVVISAYPERDAHA